MTMRALYSALVLLALPFLPLRLWWRGRREPAYRERIGERFGSYHGAPPVRPPVLWIHAVSLGETHASVPLVDRAMRTFPAATILVTHMTATGRAAGQALFDGRVLQAWLPYDAPFAVRAFLAHWRPAVGLIVETELWPNVIALSSAAGVPLFLVNARLSARSATGYARVPSLVRPMLAALTGVAAQADEDAKRLAALGARTPVVIGNLKFDLGAPANAQAQGDVLRRRFGDARPIFVAASTRDGEEALIVDALAKQALPPGALTIIVPRHPQRFAIVANLLRERGIRFVRRSDNVPVPQDIGIVLGDSMGELSAYYAVADVAFVGGSLLPLGGQNLIEPIAAGRPTLIGAHTFNFADAARNALAAGAALEVADATELMAVVAALLGDPARRERMRAAALAFHAAHRGAGDRLWAWLAPQLPDSLRREAQPSPSPAAGG
jgi:3-deoxy-D-manno-octulosonic-acid transferase